MVEKNVLIVGAAGRDFHDFNMVFRGNERFKVVGFTQSTDQNLGEGGSDFLRVYPSELSGSLYPEGVPIYPESRFRELISDKEVDEVVFSYSDVSHEDVMHKASIALSEGASFRLIGPEEMMLDSDKPIIAIDAVRTGVGKSQVSLKITDLLMEKGYNVAVVREPMPYGDFEKQEVQIFEEINDLDEVEVTIEEREEYERHLERGHVVYSGVDYEKILNRVEDEFDIVVWEGGNNELPFFKPDLHFVLADPLRAGHEKRYHPGEANLRMADFVLINKENSAEKKDIEKILNNIKELNSGAEVIHADSVVSVEEPDRIKDKTALVVEDGPTLTHGETKYGAGYVAAKKYGVKELVDPRDSAAGSIESVLEKYSDLKDVLPAIGYSDRQISDLEETIKNSDAEVIVSATPHSLNGLIDVEKPIIRVNYMVEEKNISLNEILKKFIENYFEK